MTKPCKVTAEIGAAHVGNMDRAKELIKLAKFAGADCVKFQKRNPEESVPKHLHDKPHPNEMFSYGKTYLEHRKNLELNIEQHRELQDYCENLNIDYAVSVFDLTSAKEVVNHLTPSFIKVPSACNHNHYLMDFLFDTGYDIHVSTGMLFNEEILELIKYVVQKNVSVDRFLLYHCTTEYPCQFERLYLREIQMLKFNFINAGFEYEGRYPRIGFSNHGRGIAADIAAYILGAEWIERHFIDDRTFRHTDASASLEPDGMRRLCRDLKAVYKSLTLRQTLSDEELQQREKLKVK